MKTTRSHTRRHPVAGRLGVLSGLLLLSATALPAQESARQRAERELPPEVFSGLVSLAERGDVDGIPSEPLFNKALEGLAKRVPPARLLPAVEVFAGRLAEARGAFGAAATTSLLVAGADALQRGVSGDALRQLGGEQGRSPMAVLVLADLMEAGVSSDQALDVLREAIAQRTREDRMLDIPEQVRRLIRDGTSARDAADQVRRTLQRRGGDARPPVPPGSEPPTRDRPPRDRRPGGRG